ncbi:hypothetical protein [Mesorhizobium sp. C395A]|nr:hypothetical protein [Mesorhizobium sp. C395A]ESY22448.1 hypothetical protein X751_08625 [Mesorhizobium sp. LNJC395A00]WJI76740.1 hypothetical protein NLY37_08580 [Mesorhizobium sp. C395A]
MMTTDPERLKTGLENLLDDRDYLYRLVSTIDWDAQLEAIRAVLREHRRSADHVSTNIKELEEEARTYQGPYHDHVVDEHVDAIWRSTYSDAAISLSAVGMIVPTLETIFAQAFRALGDKYVAKGIAPPDHKRWRRAKDNPERWNVQWYFGKSDAGVDIVSGLPQLCDATGVSAHLRPDDLDWIVALLSYRNRMFHGGFEWSIPQRQTFVALIAERGWDQYFVWSTTDHEPWICFLRDQVIDALPDRVFAILGSLGRFTKALPYELMSDPGDEPPPDIPQD